MRLLFRYLASLLLKKYLSCSPQFPNHTHIKYLTKLFIYCYILYHFCINIYLSHYVIKHDYVVPSLLSTWQIPRIKLADIDLRNNGSRQLIREDLTFQVMKDKLFVRWLKTKTRRQFAYSIFHKIQLFHLLKTFSSNS